MSDLFELITRITLDILVTIAYLIGQLVAVLQDIVGTFANLFGGLGHDTFSVLALLLSAVVLVQHLRLRRRVRMLETRPTTSGDLAATIMQLQQQQRAFAEEIEALEMHIIAGRPSAAAPVRHSLLSDPA